MSTEHPQTTEFWRLPKSQQLFLEEVAQAICKADGRDPDWVTSPRSDGPVMADVAIPEWRNFIPHAIVAVEAMDND